MSTQAIGEPPRITNVYLWQNGLVMVFDQYGQQMPEYQGPLEEVEEKIMAAYRGPWHGGNWPARQVWELPIVYTSE